MSPSRDIRINRDRCIGSGNCGFWAPATFDLDDEGFAIVLDPAGDDEPRILNAAHGCPTNAIELVFEGDDRGAL